MPSVLSEEDKETVRRMVPKASNKIQAVAVARLYIAYPSRSKWTYTGLQGAVVLSNDLIGNTYWLKLVDISPANMGVIWDQEIYDKWNYSQDRTFFHTFETEDYLAGLSFTDDKEAKTFLKKMVDREKNASKATKVTPFGGTSNAGGGHRPGLLGSFFGGHRHSSAPSMQPTPPDSPITYLPPRQNGRLSAGGPLNGLRTASEFAALDAIDPNWRETWGDDLKAMGITDDLIRDNQDFIASYIQEQQAAALSAPAVESPPVAELNGADIQRSRPPPPPPPTIAPRKDSESSPSTGSARRGAPPAPPPSRRSNAAPVQREPTPPREPSPPKGPPQGPPPLRFAAPPPLPDAGKFANIKDAPSRNRQHATSVSNPGPPPPPRPPKTPNEDHEAAEITPRFGVPPPFTGQRVQVPPPTPARGPVPPPPPSRETPRDSHPSYGHSVPPANALPPPLPPKTPNVASSTAPPLPPSNTRPIPPTPARDSVPPPPPPARGSVPPAPALLPPSSIRPAPASVPPVAPPLPPTSSGAAPPPPPPPPPPSSSGPPPPPPPPPNRDSGYASGVPPLPQPTGGREDVLSGIKQAGGIQALKKVDRSQIRDRSAALVPGGGDTGPHGSGLPPSGVSPVSGGGGGLADALAEALHKRKQKVGDSDDEAEGDDW